MLAVSTTSLIDARHWTVDEMKRLLDVDVHGHELAANVTGSAVAPLVDAIHRSGRVVTNLVAPCPLPKALGRRPLRAWPDLAELDRERRRAAVTGVVATIESAAQVESRFVVIECGETSASDPTPEFKRVQEARQWAQEEGGYVRSRFSTERQVSVDAHFDALCFSIDEILDHAERAEVGIALAHQRNLTSLGNVEELLRAFERFRGGPIGYWYSTNRSHAFQNLGFEDPVALRQAAIPQAFGAHLADCSLDRDNMLPGSGQLDFAALTDGIRDGAPLVLQPRPEDTVDDVDASLVHLRNLGLEGPPPEECEPFPIFGGG